METVYPYAMISALMIGLAMTLHVLVRHNIGIEREIKKCLPKIPAVPHFVVEGVVAIQLPTAGEWTIRQSAPAPQGLRVNQEQGESVGLSLTKVLVECPQETEGALKVVEHVVLEEKPAVHYLKRQNATNYQIVLLIDNARESEGDVLILALTMWKQVKQCQEY